MAVSVRGLYLRVGVLILVGLGVGLGFVLFFTAGNLGSSARTYETYVQESVQGLEVGAAVRFRGVQLGRVTDINLVATAYPPPPGRLPEAYRRVLVRFALDLSRLRDTPNNDRAVQAGLRARLSTTGITGVGYVELDFVDGQRFPVEEVPWTPDYPVIPSIPSTVAQVTNVAEMLLQRINNLPIEEILRDISGLLTDLRTQVNDGDLARTSREAADTLASVRGQIEGLNLAEIGAELRGTITEARALIGSPDVRNAMRNANAALDQARIGLQRLPAAVAQVESAARAVGNTVRDVNGDLTPALRDLRAASGNLRDTTERLRRAPGAALLGSPPPAPAWTTERSR
jgi:paraquat-inducible protein B